MEDIFAGESAERGLSVEVIKITKVALHETATSIIQQVEDGDKDPIEAMIQAKALEQMAKDMLEGLKAYAIEEAYKWEKSKGSMSGVQFTVKNLADKYSFSHCEEWEVLNKQISELTEKRKALEVQMVAARKTGEVTLPDGRKIPPATIERHGGETIEITIPK